MSGQSFQITRTLCVLFGPTIMTIMTIPWGDAPICRAAWIGDMEYNYQTTSKNGWIVTTTIKKPVDSQRLKNYVKIYQTPQLCLEKRDLSPSCVSANATGVRLSCFTPVLREALGLWENMGQKPLILASFTVMYMMIHAYPLYYIYICIHIHFF